MRVNLNTDICPIISPDTYGYEFQYTIDDYYWEDFKRDLVRVAEEYIKDALDELDIPYSNLKVSELQSPKYYNYSSDWVDFSFDVPDDYVDEIKDDYVDSDFFSFIEKQFGSHSGFISAMPYTEDRFMESDDADQIVTMWIYYLASRHMDLDKYQEDFIDDVFEIVAQNGYEYVDEDYME